MNTQRTMIGRLVSLMSVSVVAGACSLALPDSALATPTVESRYEIAWNRYHTVEQLNEHMHQLARAYPELITIEEIGRSREDRPLLVAIITAPGDNHRAKPAMWIDGAIHANEIQASEITLYSLWYLATYYSHNEPITKLLDDYAFYMMPVVSPDSRAAWFEQPSTPHSRRGNRAPIDHDRDGLVNEDETVDLDGDGSITQMWKRDPRGQWVRNPYDERIFERVPEGEFGQWTMLGREGVDLDGDGRIGEDSADGYDMNRNWPADWQPEYVQRGAGPFPFSSPETHAIARFCFGHPNIAAFQSYHNTGGMILRGPGTDYRQNAYPRADVRVFDAISAIGEELLPYYKSMVIFSDLYNVHGGEVTWASEALGVIAISNELWTTAKYFQRDVARPSDEQMWRFRDHLQFGQVFTPYTEIEHPQFGTVLVGGLNKWSSRITPTFMLEEEAHRNFAFTMFHGGHMPKLAFDRTSVQRINDRLWSVTVEIRNEKLIPTRTARMTQAGIGRNDLLICKPASGKVVASGRMNGWWETTLDEVRFEPGRVQYPQGVGSRDAIVHRFFIEAGAGETVLIEYQAEKAKDISIEIKLEEAAPTTEG